MEDGWWWRLANRRGICIRMPETMDSLSAYRIIFAVVNKRPPSCSRLFGSRHRPESGYPFHPIHDS
ncbi:UNVERIFIED_CONTAM: hypothetical protein ABIC26_004488 [Paenibacillus sp. PvR008]